jgi:ubiquinone/menaquinone biosynthesis C-methylase UbiE
MTQETIWTKFLQPVIRPLIDEKKIQNFYQSVDWETIKHRYSQPNFLYPEYYQQDFHGISQGYLNPSAAVSYDPITKHVLLPNETWVRQELIETIQVKPRKIIDLGCGTGTSTIMLQQAFPSAQVTGIDLSPYMLFMGDYKASQRGLKSINWLHRKAEATGLASDSYDLITINLLFHETPIAIAKAILQETWRLLRPGGQVVILDGNQHNLRHQTWLTEIFTEPYLKLYAQEDINIWLENVGFAHITTEDCWWLNQISQGIKHLPIPEGNLVFSF